MTRRIELREARAQNGGESIHARRVGVAMYVSAAAMLRRDMRAPQARGFDHIGAAFHLKPYGASRLRNRSATRHVHAAAGSPSMRVTVPDLSPASDAGVLIHQANRNLSARARQPRPTCRLRTGVKGVSAFIKPDDGCSRRTRHGADRPPKLPTIRELMRPRRYPADDVRLAN